MKRLDRRKIEVIDDRVAAMFRAKSPAERVAIACDANRTARQMLAARIRSLHPDWTEDQVNQEVARRMIGGTS